MADNQNTSEDIIPIDEATQQSLSLAVIKLEKEIKEVRKENRNIIIGVVVAFIFIIGTILVEIMIFHASNSCCH